MHKSTVLTVTPTASFASVNRERFIKLISSELDRHLANIHDLSKKNEDAQRCIRDLVEKSRVITDENVANKLELERKRKQMVELVEKYNKELGIARVKIQNMEKDVESITASTKTLVDASAAMTEQIKRRNATIVRLEKTCNQFEKDRLPMVNKISKQEAEIIALKKKIKDDKNSADKDISALRVQRNQWYTKHNAMESKCGSMEKDYRHLREHCDGLEKHAEHMEKQYAEAEAAALNEWSEAYAAQGADYSRLQQTHKKTLQELQELQELKKTNSTKKKNRKRPRVESRLVSYDDDGEYIPPGDDEVENDEEEYDGPLRRRRRSKRRKKQKN